MPDLEISKLPPLAGSLLQATDPVAVADLSASETKRVTVKELIQGGIALIDAGSIPADKLTATLPAGGVGTAELKDKSVTAIKLADGSTAVVASPLPVAGAYTGQLGYNSLDQKLQIWDGVRWQSLKASGSINVIQPDATGPVQIGVVQTGDSVQLDGKLADTAAAKLFLAGPTSVGGPVSYRTIADTDLPLATSTTLGGVMVTGDGLRVTAAGVVQVDNDVAAGVTYGVVTYNAKGLVTGGRAIGSGDLPAATSSAKGAVYPGLGLTVGSTGQLNHSNVIAAGTATKVSYDTNGHITGSLGLADTDIPALPASKITSGTLAADLIADHSISAAKLANYAVAYVQEAVPPTGVGSHPIGMLWLQESTGQVSIWNGNSWMKTGASTLFNRNLRYCGTYNPGTGLINGVTQFGTAEGFKINDPIPAADDKHAGCYFVASTGGTNASIAGGAAFDAGDWLLCQGATGGWVRIDTLSGAGGGTGAGGVDHLDGLLDVTLTSPRPGDLLHFTAAGQWVNVAYTDAGTYA